MNKTSINLLLASFLFGLLFSGCREQASGLDGGISIVVDSATPQAKGNISFHSITSLLGLESDTEYSAKITLKTAGQDEQHLILAVSTEFQKIVCKTEFNLTLRELADTTETSEKGYYTFREARPCGDQDISMVVSLKKNRLTSDQLKPRFSAVFSLVDQRLRALGAFEPLEFGFGEEINLWK